MSADKYKKIRIVGIVSVVIGTVIAILVVFAVSKLRGDAEVMDDVDQHFEEIARSPGSSVEDWATDDDPSPLRDQNMELTRSSDAPRRKKAKRALRSSFSPSQQLREALERQEEDLPTWPGIREVAPQTYLVEESLVVAARKNPKRFVRRVNATLAKQDDQAVGFRISGVEKTSAIFALGLRNGDVITAVNGYALKDKDEAILAFGALRFANKYRVDLLRKNRKHSFYYRVDAE